MKKTKENCPNFTLGAYEVKVISRATEDASFSYLSGGDIMFLSDVILGPLMDVCSRLSLSLSLHLNKSPKSILGTLGHCFV